MMRVRAMLEADAGAVAAINEASPEAARWGLAAYKALLSNPAAGSVLVAEREGEVAGFVCYRVVGPEAELLNLAVLPPLRRQGVGSQLLERALQQASEKGAARIFLEVRGANLAALRLYQRHGFERAGYRPGYYANPPDDAVVLSRRLPQAVGSRR